ncbi:MAG TPA: AAA family ATPase, partial [Acidimicrobiia bacterium]|nr:AAA family ATPase [Acidimicrobiia bacterium]
MSQSVARTDGLVPEDAAMLVDRLLDAMVDVIIGYEGRVDRFLGDGLLAVFGAPNMREDDAERAVRAALDIRARAATLGLGVTAGINSGDVYFGEMGGDAHREVTVMGPTVNLAARLQAKAAEGEVLVGERTEPLVRKRFAMAPRDLEIKGLAAPVRAYVIDDLIDDSTTDATLTPFVGRPREMATLTEIVTLTKSGTGRGVVITGEPGAGKSRLTSEVRRAAAGDTRWLEGRASNLTLDTAYSLFGDLFRRHLGIGRRTPPADAADHVEAFISGLGLDHGEVTPYFAAAVDVNRADWARQVASAEPEQRALHAARAITAVFRALATDHATVAVLEDLHWADARSIEVLDHLVGVVADHPLVVLATARTGSEFVERLGRHDTVTMIELGELGEAEAYRLLAELLGDASTVAPDLEALLLTRARGNPFFLEELVRSLVEQGAFVSTGDGSQMTGLEAAALVPDTVKAVIATRIDRLASDTRRVAEAASVLGSTFTVSRLAPLVPDGVNTLECLDGLARAGLVRANHSAAEATWAFVHA